jgi:hypothetical protein
MQTVPRDFDSVPNADLGNEVDRYPLLNQFRVLLLFIIPPPYRVHRSEWLGQYRVVADPDIHLRGPAFRG